MVHILSASIIAVGLIGDEGCPANLLYLGVLAVGFAGALIARLEPRGMARALFAAAVAQALVPLIAAQFWKPSTTSNLADVLGASAVFIGLWVGAGVLFQRAATNPEVQPSP